MVCVIALNHGRTRKKTPRVLLTNIVTVSRAAV